MKVPKFLAKAFSWTIDESFTRGDDRASWFTPNWSNVAGLRGPAEETNAVVAGCLGWIVDTLPEARLKVFTRVADEDKPLPVHPLYDLLETPNESAGYTWNDILGAVGASLGMDGNAYIRMRFDAYSQLVALEYLPHDLCTPKELAPGAGLGYYEVRMNGKYERVKIDEIIHVRVGIDPRNTLKGMSRFKAAMTSVLTDNEAEVYNHVILKNLGVLGWVIRPDDPNTTITEPVAKEIGDRFLRMFTGENRGRPYIPSRSVKVEQVGNTPDKMQVSEMRRYPHAAICMVFRLPPQVIGAVVGIERSTFANMKEAREAAVESCNAPMWVRITDAMIPRLRKRGILKPGQFLAFDMGTVRALQEDEDKKHERARKNFALGIWKRSESRSATNKQSGPEDDVYMTDLQLQQSEAAVLDRAAQASADRAKLMRATEG